MIKMNCIKSYCNLVMIVKNLGVQSQLKNLFLPLEPSEFDRLELSMGEDNKNAASMPAGHYLYIYDNPLPRINYSMKIDTVIDYGGLNPSFSEIYLYYLGDND